MSRFIDKFSDEEAIKQHDRYQFETRFDYRIKKRKRKSFNFQNDRSYFMNTYLFIPKVMGINKSNYKNSHFYEDLRLLLRFNEPFFQFIEISHRGGHPKNLFEKLEYTLSKLSYDKKSDYETVKDEALDLIRYFASSFVSNFRRRVKRRSRHVRKFGVNPTEASDKTVRYLRQLDSFLKKYFSLITDLSVLKEKFAYEESVADSIIVELKLAEEYCFYRFREGVALVLDSVNALEFSNDKLIYFLKKRLKIWSRFIGWYERKSNFFSVRESSTDRERENFLSRLGNIKKYLSRVLYIEAKPNRLFQIKSQAGYMIAAALAAVWYFFANLLIFSSLHFGGFGSFGDFSNLLGFGGLTILFSFVIAYVLKDRIKDLGREKFRSGIFKRLPDHVYDLIYTNEHQKKKSLGQMSEYVSFVKDRDSIPIEIRKIRESLELWNEENEYEVLCYENVIALNTESIKEIKPSFYSVKHISRFSLRRYLTRLDDPVEIYLGFDDDAKVQELRMPKLYYVGVALNFFTSDSPSPKGFDYHVLVVDKNGIVRIDDLASLGRSKKKKGDEKAKSQTVYSKE